MENKNVNINDYVSASIHKDFYYNKTLKVPTVIKEYANIEKILVHSRYIACITVQITQLTKVEYLYGSTVYNDVLGDVTKIIKEVKDDLFRGKDIFLLDLFDVDTFIIFLTSPRENDTKLLNHIESIVERIRTYIEMKIFDLFTPFIKSHSYLAIGYALAIKNPMINNIRLIIKMLNNSKEMGRFMAIKHSYRRNFGLQKIIVEEKIRTVFQPIVDLKSLEVIGYEALSRGPENTELFNPQLLFILASEFGLSFELDTLCRKIAFKTIRHLNTQKKIFINTLAMTIHDPEFRGEYLKELLSAIKIKPENVVFEINEKLAIENYDLFRNSMKDYSDIGIVQANDDTGTGYSNLERIMELNPGYMKIDISLIRNIDKNFIKQEIIKALASLAHGIGSEIIAEGVETKEEYLILRDLNIKYGQGFIFGKPSDELHEVKKETIDELLS